MIKLQKKLADDKQCLELEIEQIRRDHREAQEKIEAREEKLKEMGDKIEYLVDATQTLATWERKTSYYELEDARKVMIRVSLFLVAFLICTILLTESTLLLRFSWLNINTGMP